jgi:hypothetical protein
MRNFTRFALFGLACLAAVNSAKGTTLFGIQSAFAASGSTNNALDVFISNLGPSSVDIGGFSWEITVSGADVTLNSATTATVLPYIFEGNSAFGPVISTSSPGQTMDASDIVATINSSTTIGAGQTFGLGRLFFDVAPSALENEVLTLDFNPSNSSLSDADGNPIPIDTFQSGTITIVASVPEPRTGITLSSLLVVFAIWRMIKRRQTGA